MNAAALHIGGMPGETKTATGVTRVTLSDFRCYARLRLDADLRPAVLTGPNGAGKTNLIEALSFLTPGRGLRRARLAEVTRRDAGDGAGWAVAATVQTPSGPVEVGTGRESGQGEGRGGSGEPRDRRVVRIDGETVRGQVALAEVASAVWLTPAMDRLFVEGASARRRFLDRLAFGLDTGHAARVSAYENALRQRARLLREERRADPAWLAALEETMAETGVAVAAARRDVVARLARACAGADGPFPRAVPTLEGTVETWLDEGPALEVESRLRRALSAGRSVDGRTGGAAEGPHRSDLLVRHGDKDMPAAHCSTGEQKALLISLVLAQARIQTSARGWAPLLLLDEVVAHLDETRRRALFDTVCALGAQAWMTGTDQSLFAGLGERGQFFRVQDAAVTRQSAV